MEVIWFLAANPETDEPLGRSRGEIGVVCPKIASYEQFRLIGSENPGYGGGLVLGGIILLIQERRERDVSPSGWSGCVEGFFLCIGS